MEKPNKKAKLGQGGRFAAVVKSVEKSGKSPEQAKAIAAAVGRKKHGVKKMATLAKRGR
jgi:hypothetical protein